jgi:hypothetical protein
MGRIMEEIVAPILVFGESVLGSRLFWRLFGIFRKFVVLVFQNVGGDVWGDGRTERIELLELVNGQTGGGGHSKDSEWFV